MSIMRKSAVRLTTEPNWIFLNVWIARTCSGELQQPFEARPSGWQWPAVPQQWHASSTPLGPGHSVLLLLRGAELCWSLKLSWTVLFEAFVWLWPSHHDFNTCSLSQPLSFSHDALWHAVAIPGIAACMWFLFFSIGRESLWGIRRSWWHPSNLNSFFFSIERNNFVVSFKEETHI